MDLSHGRPYVDTARIYAGTYDDITDCSLIIITAGANQSQMKPDWIWFTKTLRS